MIDGVEISTVVYGYLERFPSEREHLRPFLDLLGANAAVTGRSTYPGHVTCSALVIDEADRMLRIWHNGIGKWLQPGGHVEADDAGLLDAALRELAEETGIVVDASCLLDFGGGPGEPIDVDVHSIGASRAKGEGKHLHFDFRYAFALPAAVEITLQWEEVSGFHWASLDEITSPRVADKLRAASRPAGIRTIGGATRPRLDR